MGSKICTTLEQSKRLIELGIDIDTADMCYRYKWHNNNFILLPCIEKAKEPITGDIPAWSLTALMSILDCGALFKTPKGYAGQTYDEYKAITGNYHSNPVDACFETVCWLLENNKL